MVPIDITYAFQVLWNALQSVVTWLQGHGIRLIIGEDYWDCSFFVIAIAIAVLNLILSLVPIFEPIDESDYDILSYWGDDAE